MNLLLMLKTVIRGYFPRGLGINYIPKEGSKGILVVYDIARGKDVFSETIENIEKELNG